MADPDEQCREHGCARWRCDHAHAPDHNQAWELVTHEPCNCQQSLDLAARLKVCSEALDAIKGLCLAADSDWNRNYLGMIGSIVALADANLERLK